MELGAAAGETEFNSTRIGFYPEGSEIWKKQKEL